MNNSYNSCFDSYKIADHLNNIFNNYHDFFNLCNHILNDYKYENFNNFINV